MAKVAIIGSGPCGLSILRAFQQAEEKGSNIPELVCLRNKMIGEVYGIIVGELDLINMVTLFPTVCIGIYGPMVPKNV